MQRLYTAVLTLVVSLSLLSFINPSRVSASSFDKNNLIATSTFENVTSYSISQINNLLNSYASSCISPNNGFVTPDPLGFSGSSYQFGGNVSAGQAIYDISQHYHVNPQVVLATLQKEQSVVTGSAGCYPNTPDPNATQTSPCGTAKTPCTTACPYNGGGCMTIAMSYSCPNYCYAGIEGFSNQLSGGTWLLRFAEERAYGILTGYTGYDSGDETYHYGGPMTQGWRQRWDTSTSTYYDGSWTTSDGTSVQITNGATASLYTYTPFISGNQSFDTLFQNWFGSPTITTPYAWGYRGQWAYSDSARTQPFTSVPTVAPGSKIYVTVKALNLGAQTWVPSLIHLGTSHSMDRASAFADVPDGWLNNARAAQLVESSVQSGETGTFQFAMLAPNSTGTYNEYFNLLAEGITWMNDPGMYFTINVNSARTSSTDATILGNAQILNKGEYKVSPQDSQSVLTLQSDGNLVLYSNFQPVWSTGPMAGAVKVAMQPDGNLVAYTQNNVALWASTTSGSGAHLLLQPDGNLVLYPSSGTALWDTKTFSNPNHLAYVNTTLNPGRMYPGQSIDTADGRYHLMLQTDGNLVLYSQTSGAIWATATDGKNVSFLAMQPDGNLVLYDTSGKPLWYSGTAGHGSLRLVVQQDGNLVLYNAANMPVWNTGPHS